MNVFYKGSKSEKNGLFGGGGGGGGGDGGRGWGEAAREGG